MPHVSRPNRRSYRVRTLAWLIRHAGEVVAITIADAGHGSAVLTALLADGGTFIADFADTSSAREWVHRRCLRTIPLTLMS